VITQSPARSKSPVLLTAMIGFAAAMLAPALALGNGRPPSSVSVTSHPGRNDILIATTFGVLLSVDDGCSFHWLCEQSIGYGGTFDPKYAIGADGTIYATTFEGLRVSRDRGCTFTTATRGLAASDPGSLDGIWVDAIEVAGNGDVWIATAESGRFNDVYVSRDAGRTFTPAGLHSASIWWKSVKIARARPARIYVTGYQIAGSTPEGGQMPPTAHLRRSDDGGATWSAMPLAAVALAATPVVHVIAVDPENPDVVYLRSAGAVAPSGDKLYRSSDGARTFTEVLATSEPVQGMVIRGRAVIVAAGMGGAYESSDGGVTFSPVVDAPRMACIHDRGNGQLLACGTNWDPDFFSVAVSSDGQNWQKLFRFADISGPLPCATTTVQHDVCELSVWPSLREQFGATKGTPATCPAAPAVVPPTTRSSGGCCDGAGSGGGALMVALSWLALAAGRRRRRDSTASSARAPLAQATAGPG
jgi:hypothetical protein